MAGDHPHSTFEKDQHCERVNRASGSGSQEAFRIDSFEVWGKAPYYYLLSVEEKGKCVSFAVAPLLCVVF